MKKPGPRIWLEPVRTGEKVAASFAVKAAGLPVGKKLTVDFLEVDPPAGGKRDELRKQASGEVKLGSVPVVVKSLALAEKLTGVPTFALSPTAPPAPPAADAEALVEFFFPGTPDPYRFAVPAKALDIDEGDYWELQVRCDDPKMASPIMTIAHVRRSLEPGAANYRWHDGHTLHPYHDGAKDSVGDTGAFADILAAIDKAEHLVFVVDWSFHPFFDPNMGSHALAGTIGGILLKKAAAGVTVAIHTWDHTYIAAPDAQNDTGDDWFAALATYFNMAIPRAHFRWRAGSPSGISNSHHQKFVVVDQPSQDGRRELRVFFGGLDMTQGRLDWKEHPVSAHDPVLASRRLSWGTSARHLTNEWYNAETEGDLALPRQPWHDIHGSLEGPATWDFVREFVARWGLHPGSQSGDGVDDSNDPVCEIWKALLDRDKWVQQDEPHDGPWAAQLLRSNTQDRVVVPDQLLPDAARPLYWSRDLRTSSDASIQHMYQQAIDHADRFIYIENQYLIGSGKHWDRDTVANDLPERIVKKILSKKGKPFHAYVITPLFPEGKPTSTGSVEVRSYEWKTIEYMVKALSAELGQNWSDYLSFYFLAHWDRVDPKLWSNGDRNARLGAHQRYMVYVHSKLMIVDDRFMIFGSANLNERSLSGDRDTEIACGFWPSRGKESICIPQLRAFRTELFAEHFGAPPPGVTDPASPACWDACQKIGEDNYLSFRRMQTPRLGHACRLPVSLTAAGLSLGGQEAALHGTHLFPEPLRFLPDGEPSSEWWGWTCRGSRLSFALGTAAE